MEQQNPVVLRNQTQHGKRVFGDKNASVDYIAPISFSFAQSLSKKEDKESTVVMI